MLNEIKTTLEEPQLITIEELAVLKAQIKQLITTQANSLNKKRAQTRSDSDEVEVIKLLKNDVVAPDTTIVIKVNKYYYNTEALYIDIKTRNIIINLEKAMRLGKAKEYSGGSI